MLYPMLQNSGFSLSTDTNLYVKLNQIRNVRERATLNNEDLSLNTGNAKSCTMAIQMVFSGLRLHRANTGSWSRPPNSCLFSISCKAAAPQTVASISPTQCNICIELKLHVVLSDLVTLLLHLEFDASFQIDWQTSRPVAETWTSSISILRYPTWLHSWCSSRPISLPLSLFLD